MVINFTYFRDGKFKRYCQRWRVWKSFIFPHAVLERRKDSYMGAEHPSDSLLADRRPETPPAPQTGSRTCRSRARTGCNGTRDTSQPTKLSRDTSHWSRGHSQPSYHGKSITKLKWWKGQGKVGHKRGIKEANDDLVAFISTLLFFLEAQNYSSSFCILTPRDWLEKYMTHLIYLMSFTIQLSKLSKSQLLEGAGCL